MATIWLFVLVPVPKSFEIRTAHTALKAMTLETAPPSLARPGARGEDVDAFVLTEVERAGHVGADLVAVDLRVQGGCRGRWT